MKSPIIFELVFLMTMLFAIPSVGLLLAHNQGFFYNQDLSFRKVLEEPTSAADTAASDAVTSQEILIRLPLNESVGR